MLGNLKKIYIHFFCHCYYLFTVIVIYYNILQTVIYDIIHFFMLWIYASHWLSSLSMTPPLTLDWQLTPDSAVLWNTDLVLLFSLEEIMQYRSHKNHSQKLGVLFFVCVLETQMERDVSEVCEAELPGSWSEVSFVW